MNNRTGSNPVSSTIFLGRLSGETMLKLRKEKIFYLLIFVLCIQSIFNVLDTLIVKYSLDNFSYDYIVFLIIFGAIYTSLRNASTYLNYILNCKLVNKLSDTLIDKILNLDYLDYIDYGKGELINLSKNKIENLVLNVIFYITNICGVIFDLFAMFGVLIFLNKNIAFLYLIFTFMFITSVLGLQKLYGKYEQQLNVQEDILTQKISNLINGFETIKLFNINNYVKKDYMSTLFEKQTMRKKTVYLDIGITVACNIFYYGLIIIMLVYKLQYGLEMSTIAAFLLLINYLFNPIWTIINCLDANQRFKKAYQQVNDLLNKKNKIKSGNAELKDIQNIEFKNVYFSLHNKLILNNINLHINKGQMIGICGESGGGKSTLIKLLMHYYNCEGIYINNVNIKEYSLSSLYNVIGFVPQNACLFNDTIRNNICLDKEIDDNKLYDILEQVNLPDLKNDLDKMVGENGIKLSNGQKQRIVIARTLLKNTPILIFDESTSALDKENEKIIQEIIYKLNKTCIIIAHNISTIKDCDEIVVIKNNKIYAKGNYNELLNNKYFRKLL